MGCSLSSQQQDEPYNQPIKVTFTRTYVSEPQVSQKVSPTIPSKRQLRENKQEYATWKVKSGHWADF
jgi:hypothetical protein